MQAAHDSEVAALKQEVQDLHEQISQMSRESSVAREAGSRLDGDNKENADQRPSETEKPKSEFKIKTTKIKQGNTIRSVSLSNNGQLLATGSADNTACVTDIATGQTLRTIEHDDFDESVSLSSDGKLLANGSWDKNRARDRHRNRTDPVHYRA